MKQGKITIDGKTYSLTRGVVARIYYAKDSSPCRDKPLRLWHIVDGKAKSSWHSLEEIDALNARASEMNASARIHGENFAIPSRDESNAVRLYREFCDARRASGEEIPSLSEIVSVALTRENTKTDTPRISEVAVQYLEDKKRHKNLTRGHLHLLERIFKFLADKTGDKKLAEVRIDEVEKIVSDTGLQTASLRTYYTNIHALFKWYYARENSTRRPIDRLANPLELLKAPPLTKEKEPEIISPELLKSYLEAVRNKKPEMLPAIIMQAFCGVRRAEALRLKWKDLAFTSSTTGNVFLSYKITKTKTSRTAPIPECAMAWLALTKKQTPEAFIAFPKFNGSNREEKTNSARVCFDATCGVKLPRNSLRHSVATYLATLYGNDKSADICGHDKKTSGVYYRTFSSESVANEWFNVFPSK